MTSPVLERVQVWPAQSKPVRSSTDLDAPQGDGVPNKVKPPSDWHSLAALATEERFHMATAILPHNCPICKEDIRAGQRRRVIGHDLSSGIPTNIYAHADCVEAVDFRACVVIRPGDMVGAMIPRLEAAYA